jgi:hypothetical protein
LEGCRQEKDKSRTEDACVCACNSGVHRARWRAAGRRKTKSRTEDACVCARVTVGCTGLARGLQAEARVCKVCHKGVERQVGCRELICAKQVVRHYNVSLLEQSIPANTGVWQWDAWGSLESGMQEQNQESNRTRSVALTPTVCADLTANEAISWCGTGLKCCSEL